MGDKTTSPLSGATAEPDPARDPRRWPQLAWLAVTVLLAMFLWFSATAALPQLTRQWGLSSGQQAWLTIAVQLGFVSGALGSALLNVADRVPGPRLIAVSSAIGCGANAWIALAPSPSEGGALSATLWMRWLTGVALAGVYPPGMKLMASWFRHERGLAIGVLVGALTLGSASPHLFNLLPWDRWNLWGLEPWRLLLLLMSLFSAVAAMLALTKLRSGPLLSRNAAPFRWSYAVSIWRNEPLRRANFGYLGHQWELYAMWAWAPVFLRECFQDRPVGKLAGFAAIAAGAVGCVVLGRWADQAGRCRMAMLSLSVSGGCALAAGFLLPWPWLAAAVCVVWGWFVVADSAQFSAAVSELSDPRYIGTALTVQTCAGFLLTTVSIALLSWLRDRYGWGPTFASLALGPAFGAWHMWRLQRMPQAAAMASGNR